MGQNPLYDSHKLADGVTGQQRVLLVRLMEEAAELQHACAKVLRWGWNSTNPMVTGSEKNIDAVDREFDDVQDIMQRLRKTF